MNQPVALVTGASGGIGAAICSCLAEEGWHVVGADIQSLADVDRSVQVDVAEPLELNALAASVREEEGRLDALIHNAAVQVCGALESISIEDWDRLMAVNLRAPFWLSRQCLDMLETSSGAIVNVGSVHSVATSAEISSYAASKGGLAALTRAMALELASRSVRVNAVLPGAVETPMLMSGFERGHIADGSPESQLADFGKRHPLGRVGQPAEIAHAVSFLVDRRRASYITGTCLIVDGGVTARLSTE